MEHKHRKQILECKERAAYYKAVRIYSDYMVRMNDVWAVIKMIRDDNISEKNITKAMITYHGSYGKNHAKKCIREARKSIYKGIRQAYSPFLKIACGRTVFWKDIDIIDKIEVGALVYCEKCEKTEEITEIIDTETMRKILGLEKGNLL